MSLRGVERRRRTAPGLLAKLSAGAVLIVVLGSGCGEGQRESGAAARGEDAGLAVYVVNYRLAYFATRV